LIFFYVPVYASSERDQFVFSASLQLGFPRKMNTKVLIRKKKEHQGFGYHSVNYSWAWAAWPGPKSRAGFGPDFGARTSSWDGLGITGNTI
jgi:hypothetical protein